jgi:hypothetical protein
MLVVSGSVREASARYRTSEPEMISRGLRAQCIAPTLRSPSRWRRDSRSTNQPQSRRPLRTTGSTRPLSSASPAFGCLTISVQPRAGPDGCSPESADMIARAGQGHARRTDLGHARHGPARRLQRAVSRRLAYDQLMLTDTEAQAGTPCPLMTSGSNLPCLMASTIAWANSGNCGSRSG